MYRLVLTQQPGVTPDTQAPRRDFLTAATVTTYLVLDPSSLLATERLPKVPGAAQSAAPVKREQVKLSDGLVALVKEFEGLSLTAYKCPAGVLTIGYGHAHGVTEGDTLKNVAAAEDLLCKDLRRHRRTVETVFKDALLTANQIEALTSADFNCGCMKSGASGLAKFLQQKLPQLNGATDRADRQTHLTDAITYLCRYNRSKGNFVDGLLRRRLSEGLLLAGAANPVVPDEQYDKLKAEVLKATGQKGAKIESHLREITQALLKKRGLID